MKILSVFFLLFCLLINFQVFSQCIVNVSPTPNLFGCVESMSPVEWTDIVGVNATGSDIDRISGNGWNSGAASTHDILDNMFVSTVADETNKLRLIGLSSTNSNANFNTIEFGFLLRTNGGIRIYESGINRGNFGSYNTGDTLKISAENSVIKYYINEVLLYTSTVGPSFPLIVDASIYSNNGTLKDVNIGTFVNNDFSCLTTNMGTNLTYQWKLNGTNVGGNSATYTNSNLTNSDVLLCEVTPSAAFCAGSTVSSNTLFFKDHISQDMTSYIQPAYTGLGCVRAETSVNWSELVNITQNGNNISRTSGNGWGTSGAVSTNLVNDNMYVRTVINEVNRRRSFGLSSSNINEHYNTIDFAFYLNNNGTIRIYESGSYRGAFGNYLSNDTLCIKAENGVVNYYQNDQLLYSSSVSPSFPLLVDVSFNQNNATIEQTVIGGLMENTFVCNAANAGSNPNYQWFYNNLPVGSNSSTYLNNSIVQGDSIFCHVTPSFGSCSGVTLITQPVFLSIDNNNGSSVQINPTFIANGCKKSIMPVVWENQDFVQENGNSITKSGSTGWNSGANSITGIGENMFLTSVINESTTYRMLGVSNNTSNANYTSIDYSFYLIPGNNIYIYESGNYAANVGLYNSNDVLKIGVESNIVNYYVNDVLVYSSSVTPTLPLYADCSLYSNGATFENVNIEGFVQDSFTCTGTGLGSAANYQWTLNGQSVGSNNAFYNNANLSDSDVLQCTVTSSINNCNSIAIQSQPLSIKVDFSDNLGIAVNAVPVTSGCLIAESDVQWVDKVNVTATNNNIFRTSGNSWGGSGAASVNQVNDNMYMSTIAAEVNTYRMIGLSSINANANWNTIDFAMYLWPGGGITIYESGTFIGYLSDFVTGDTLKIAVEAGVVKYFKNNVSFYTSAVTPSLPLIVDAAIYSNGGTFNNVVVGGLANDTYTCSTYNTGVNPIYQWYLNGMSVGTNSSTYINPTLGLSDSVWCEVVPDVSNCYNTTLVSNTVILNGTNYDFTSWTGSTNTNWSVVSNWSNGLPNSNKSAIIPSGLSLYPVINGNADCQNLIIESGATLDLISIDTIFVNGTWQNSGIVNNNSGTISLSPNCSNSLSFYNSAPISVNNVLIDNGAEVIISGSKVSVKGALALENGSLNTGDSLRMVSDANETARITEIKNGTIIGNVEVERYIDAGATNWRFLTLPVSGQDLEAFDDDFITSGFTGTDFPNFPSPSNPFSSFYYYSESAGTNFVDGYLTPNATSQSVDMGQGWWIWCGDSLQGTNPFTIDAVGPIYQGDQSLPVSYTPSSGLLNEDGWNMVANPYQCTIDWDNPNWVKSNIDGAIFIWNPDLAQYASYNAGVGTNLGDNKIASSQAFWVHSNGPSPVLTIKESCKVNQDHGFIKKAIGQLSLLRLKLTTNSTFVSDETVVRIEENTSLGFDSDFDALKFYSSDYASVQLASTINNKDFTINAIDSDSLDYVDLKVIIPVDDSCVLTATDLSAFQTMSCILIEDLLTGDFINLQTDSVHYFTQTAYNYIPRLRIHFTNKPQVTISHNSCSNSNDGLIDVVSYNNNINGYYLMNMAGDTVSITNSVNNLSAGTYYMHYTNLNAECYTVEDSFIITEPQEIFINNQVQQSTCENCCDGEIIISMTGGTAPFDIYWDNPIISAGEIASNLCSGSYRVAIIDNNGCEATAEFEVGNLLSNQELSVGNYKLFPNPTAGRLIIEGEILSNQSIICFNNLGQNITNRIIFNVFTSNKIEADMSDLPVGIYFFQIENHTFTVNKY